MKVKKIIASLLVLALLAGAYSIDLKASDGDTWLNPTAQGYVNEISAQYGIQPELVEAIIETESSCNNSATNGTCYGYMQVNGAVWGYGYRSEYANISKGVEVLANYFEQADGEVCLALDLYNGNSKAHRLNESGTISTYAKKITTRAHELEVLHYGS